MWQLKVASELKRGVPRTCMTNSPERARQFIAGEAGDVIYKAFRRDARDVARDADHHRTQVAQLDQVRLAPVISRKRLLADATSGSRWSATAFPAQITGPADGYEYDFRLHTAQSAITPVDLPDAVTAALLALMRRLGLWYGAIDLRRAPDGDYVFLEINPPASGCSWNNTSISRSPVSLAMLLARLDRDQRQAA